MADFTLEELCWLWVIDSEAPGGPRVSRKLEQAIAQLAGRELDELEIRGLIDG